jgi:hypothetical protein
MMQNKDEASVKLRPLMYVFVALLFLLVARLGVHTYLSITNEPEVEDVLLNQQGGIFGGEDLSQSSLSEGQVKQLFYEIVSKSLSYDYLSFASKEKYQEYIRGDESVDLPDHRDVLAPWFTDGAYKALLSDVAEMPWMNDFYNERIQLFVKTSRPPVRLNISQNWRTNSAGELEASYSGFVYVDSRSPVTRNHSYRVDYEGTIKRVPLSRFEHSKGYYFPALVDLNTSGWKVSNLKLEVTRRN